MARAHASRDYTSVFETREARPIAPANHSPPSTEQIQELIALYNQGRFREVVEKGESVARQSADSPFVENLLGAANIGLGRMQQAASRFLRAVRIKPDYAEAHNNLGNVLRDLKKPEEAAASYNRAIEINPNYAEAHNNLGIVLRNLGRLDEAMTCYERALEINPDYATAHGNLSATKKYSEVDAQARRMLELIEQPDLPINDRTHLCFALGKVYSDLGSYDEAFAHISEGNRLRREQSSYDTTVLRGLFDRIVSTTYSELPPTDDAEALPLVTDPQVIFVLGMPRSGTSLVEQILASHSKVYGGGELDFLEQSIRAAEWDSTSLSPDQLQTIRRTYFSKLEKIGASESNITDKQPFNFLWIGLILAAIPAAKIVHVVRDARAVCWSNFKHYYSTNAIGFAYDLKDVADFYRMYSELMTFWHQRFPGRVFDIGYETLTENQEAETRKLLEFAGLEWEDRCLEFHKTKRAVRTASDAQVRQELYQGSSDEWRKYEKHLAPLLESLSEPDN